MHELVIVDLSYNNIESLNFYLFYKGNKIEEFRIYSNKIKTIELDFFREAKHLKILDLSKNELYDLSVICFTNMISLTKISFWNNNISKISNFNKNINLEHIDLSSNIIQTIQSKTFNNLSDLVKINLRDNPIEFIEPNAFYNCKNLQDIELPINNLSKKSLYNLLNKLNNFSVEERNGVEYFKSIHVTNTDITDQRLCFLMIYFLRYRSFVIQLDLFDEFYSRTLNTKDWKSFSEELALEYFMNNCLNLNISQSDKFENLN